MTEQTDSVQTSAPPTHQVDAHAEHVASGEGMPAAAGHPAAEFAAGAPQVGEVNVATGGHAPQPPVDNDHVAPGAEKFGTRPPTPAPAPTGSTGSGTATAPPPAVSLGRIVLVREKGFADSPCIVTSVANGLVSGNVFRGTHIPHVAENLSEIDPGNTTGQGWFWPPRV